MKRLLLISILMVGMNIVGKEMVGAGCYFLPDFYFSPKIAVELQFSSKGQPRYIGAGLTQPSPCTQGLGCPMGEFPTREFRFSPVIVDNDFDPRNEHGRQPVNLEEAKNSLRRIFYSGLSEALKNHQLLIIAQTLKQIEKVFDLTGKVLSFPFSIFRFPFVPAILPTLKDFLEKLFSTINRTVTSGGVDCFLVLTYQLINLLTYQLFLTLLTLSTVVLRL